MSKDPVSKIELLRRAQEGDEVALSELFKVMRKLVRRYVFTLRPEGVRAYELADDALTHAIMRLHQCRARTDGKMVSWFYTIARNHVYQYYRTPDGFWEAHKEPDPFLLLELQAPDAPAEPTTVQRSIFVKLFREAFELESEDDRLILMWRLHSGAEWYVIAKRLGIVSGEAAKQSANRSKARIRERVRQAGLAYTALGPDFQHYLVEIGVLKPSDLS